MGTLTLLDYRKASAASSFASPMSSSSFITLSSSSFSPSPAQPKATKASSASSNSSSSDNDGDEEERQGGDGSNKENQRPEEVEEVERQTGTWDECQYWKDVADLRGAIIDRMNSKMDSKRALSPTEVGLQRKVRKLLTLAERAHASPDHRIKVTDSNRELFSKRAGK